MTHCLLINQFYKNQTIFLCYLLMIVDLSEIIFLDYFVIILLIGLMLMDPFAALCTWVFWVHVAC